MEKLLKLQSELRAPKDRYNKFGGYQYRSAEGILEAVKPLCAKYGCILTLTDEMVLLGSRYYIKATVTITDTESKESVSTTAFAREEEVKKGMDSSQITGTASSYARKYALNGLFCIDDAKDADTEEYHKQTTPTVNTEDLRMAIGLCNTETELKKVWTEIRKLQKSSPTEFAELKNLVAEKNKQLKGE